MYALGNILEPKRDLILWVRYTTCAVQGPLKIIILCKHFSENEMKSIRQGKRYRYETKGNALGRTDATTKP